jgi:hypothetical protein
MVVTENYTNLMSIHCINDKDAHKCSGTKINQNGLQLLLVQVVKTALYDSPNNDLASLNVILQWECLYNLSKTK